MRRAAKIVISILFLLFIRPILKLSRLLKSEKSFYCIIIYYHSIPRSGLKTFKTQIRILQKFTTVIALGNNYDLDKARMYSIITFDDAFQSVIKNAVPELLKRKIPFTIFIPAGKMGVKPDWSGYSDDFDEIVAAKDELINMPNELVTFGSHTINHVYLSKVIEEEAFKEIKGSKDMLESILHRKIRFMSFPYGDYDKNVLILCKKAGYEQTFGIRPESPFSPLNKYDKGRIKIETSTWPIEFMLFILGAYDWVRIKNMLKTRLENINN